MTGNVPYYGGRLTPAQAYTASHPAPPPPRAPAGARSTTLDALEHLRAAGVITESEYAQVLKRINN
jgi:hypothetical protein